MSTFFLYVLLILPSVKGYFTAVFGGLLIAVLAFGFINMLCMIDATDSGPKIKKVWTKIMWPAIGFLCVLLIVSFIPSFPLVFALIGWELAGSDVFADFGDLPPKLVEYLNAVIDVELTEMKRVK